MRVTKPVVFSLVSLVCTVNAIKANSKPILAKRQAIVTVTSNGCTAVCVDHSDIGMDPECEVFCDRGFSTEVPAASTSTLTLGPTPMTTVTLTVTRSTHKRPSAVTTETVATTSIAKRTTNAPVNQGTTITATNSVCSETCSIDLEKGDFDCSFECDVDLPTPMPASPTSKAVLNRRSCNEVCSHILARAFCDVLCLSDIKTTMPASPTSKAVLNRRSVVSFVDGDCTAICWDLMPGTECDVQCSSDFKTMFPGNIAHSSGANGFHYLALLFPALNPYLLPCFIILC